MRRNNIPGFRSNVMWKKIIAAIFYLIMLGILLVPQGITFGDKLLVSIEKIFGMVIPFMLIFNIKNLRDKLPLFKRKKVGSTIIGTILFLFVFSMVISATSILYSPQYKAELAIAQEEREAEERAKEEGERKEAEEKVREEEDALAKEEEARAKKEAEEKAKKEAEEKAKKEEEAKETSNSVSGNLKVHFIDVGQADSILVEQGNNAMLIDAGNNDDTEILENYLNDHNIKELQYFVGTHAHEDHIGSADYVINSFKVNKVYFPRQTANTRTFEDFVSAVKNKGLKLTAPSLGESFKLGEATVTVLAPNSSSYEDANDYSIVLKITYGKTSFLLTGDAEAVSESEMVAGGMDLSASLLKIGHHGSRSSTSEAFLNKVNPKYAVITVGRGNSYGHPTEEVMNRLKARNIPVYRTDENGTIVATSDGDNITFSVGPGSYNFASSSSKSSSSSNSQTNKTTTSEKQSTSNTNSQSSSQSSSKPSTQPSPQPETTETSTSGTGKIKGNINSKGEKIYHMPGGAYYDRTDPEVWFSTEEEAQAAGFRRSKR